MLNSENSDVTIVGGGFGLPILFGTGADASVNQTNRGSTAKPKLNVTVSTTTLFLIKSSMVVSEDGVDNFIGLNFGAGGAFILGGEFNVEAGFKWNTLKFK